MSPDHESSRTVGPKPASCGDQLRPRGSAQVSACSARDLSLPIRSEDIHRACRQCQSRRLPPGHYMICFCVSLLRRCRRMFRPRRRCRLALGKEQRSSAPSTCRASDSNRPNHSLTSADFVSESARSSGGHGSRCSPCVYHGRQRVRYDGFRRLEPLPDGPSQAVRLSATTSESRDAADV
jgi:hypothetical protein